jgi:hypothetical protein
MPKPQVLNYPHKAHSLIREAETLSSVNETLKSRSVHNAELLGELDAKYLAGGDDVSAVLYAMMSCKSLLNHAFGLNFLVPWSIFHIGSGVCVTARGSCALGRHRSSRSLRWRLGRHPLRECHSGADVCPNQASTARPPVLRAVHAIPWSPNHGIGIFTRTYPNRNPNSSLKLLTGMSPVWELKITGLPSMPLLASCLMHRAAALRFAVCQTRSGNTVPALGKFI